jgi:AcrR family transcriptional regulator
MSKGAETRERILDRAFRLAARDGLAGLSLSALAAELDMSKSGLFGHFTSKEALQVALLERAAGHFEAKVVLPAFRQAAGLPRLRELFRLWLSWINHRDHPGGCIFVSASTELDDQAGPARDVLVTILERLRSVLKRLVTEAIDQGQLRPKQDAEQLVFEIYGLALAYHYHTRLLGLGEAEDWAVAGLERIVGAASSKR